MPNANCGNHENYRITYENYETHENLGFPYENYKNHKNIKIDVRIMKNNKNHLISLENKKIISISKLKFRITTIIEILEFHVIIKKIMKIM